MARRRGQGTQSKSPGALHSRRRHMYRSRCFHYAMPGSGQHQHQHVHGRYHPACDWPDALEREGAHRPMAGARACDPWELAPQTPAHNKQTPHRVNTSRPYLSKASTSPPKHRPPSPPRPLLRIHPSTHHTHIANMREVISLNGMFTLPLCPPAPNAP